MGTLGGDYSAARTQLPPGRLPDKGLYPRISSSRSTSCLAALCSPVTLTSEHACPPHPTLVLDCGLLCACPSTANCVSTLHVCLLLQDRRPVEGPFISLVYGTSIGPCKTQRLNILKMKTKVAARVLGPLDPWHRRPGQALTIPSPSRGGRVTTPASLLLPAFLRSRMLS